MRVEHESYGDRSFCCQIHLWLSVTGTLAASEPVPRSGVCTTIAKRRRRRRHKISTSTSAVCLVSTRVALCLALRHDQSALLLLGHSLTLNNARRLGLVVVRGEHVIMMHIRAGCVSLDGAGGWMSRFPNCRSPKDKDLASMRVIEGPPLRLEHHNCESSRSPGTGTTGLSVFSLASSMSTRMRDFTD